MIKVGKQKLRELAEGVKHWGNSVADVWPSDPDYNDSWAVGGIDGDGNKYPVIEVDADQYDAPGDSEKLARFFAASNPATVLALLDEIEALRKDKARLDSRCIVTNECDEFGEEYHCERRGLDLRAAIDMAMMLEELDRGR